MLKICVYSTFEEAQVKDVSARLKAAGLHPEEKRNKYFDYDFGHKHEVTRYFLVVPLREWLWSRRNIHYMFPPSRPRISIRLVILTGIFLLTLIYSIWIFWNRPWE